MMVGGERILQSKQKGDLAIKPRQEATLAYWDAFRSQDLGRIS